MSQLRLSEASEIFLAAGKSYFRHSPFHREIKLKFPVWWQRDRKISIIPTSIHHHQTDYWDIYFKPKVKGIWEARPQRLPPIAYELLIDEIFLTLSERVKSSIRDKFSKRSQHSQGVPIPSTRLSETRALEWLRVSFLVLKKALLSGNFLQCELDWQAGKLYLEIFNLIIHLSPPISEKDTLLLRVFDTQKSQTAAQLSASFYHEIGPVYDLLIALFEDLASSLKKYPSIKEGHY